MNRKKVNPDASQTSLFFPDKDLVDNINNITIKHRKNFGIEEEFLLSLNIFNSFLSKPGRYSKDDNLLLRDMYGGIMNSIETPSEIFDALNSIEICFLEPGIYKRKYRYTGTTYKQPKSIFAEPIKIEMNINKDKNFSRIAEKVDLPNADLYDIFIFLFNATGLKKIYKKYESGCELEICKKDKDLFKRLNPYEPSTLKQRMDYVNFKYPAAVEIFKKVLEKEIINSYAHKSLGNNLENYSKKVYNYFQEKEILFMKN